MDNAPEYAMSHTAYEIVLHNDFVKSVGEWCVLNKIKHINIRKGRKESNGKVENTNRMIDYELLPLVHRVKSVKDIKDITKHYDNLHNTLIRRTFKRIINGTLKKFV
jgi:transposase InsO family protein